MRAEIPFYGGFNDPDIRNFNTDIPVNWHPVTFETSTGQVIAMIPSPGTLTDGDLHTHASSDNVRGLHRMNGATYVVVGNELFQVNDSSNVVGASLGTVAGTSGAVRMFHKFVSDGTNSNYELGIIAGGNLYSYISGATTPLQNVSATTYTTTTNTGAGPTSLNDGTVLNNRALITRSTTSQFYVGIDIYIQDSDCAEASLGGTKLSALRMGTTQTLVPTMTRTIGWRVANLTAREDTCKGIMRNNLNFYLFGTRVLEAWTNAGVAGNPFRRINGEVYDLGCAATATIQQATTPQGIDVTVFLAQDSYGALSVIMLGSGGAIPLSNKQIEAYLADNVTDSSDATAFFYRENNDLYYQLNFTTDNFTFVYDFERKAWHKRQDNSGNRHIADCSVYYNGKTIVGGYNDKRLYHLSTDNLTDDLNGTIEPIYKKFQFGLLQDKQYRRLFANRLEIDFIQGTGKTGWDDTSEYDEGADPIVYLSYSRDRGNRWSNSVQGTLGTSGKLNYVTRWRRMGSSKEGYVFRLESWSRQSIIMLGAVLDMSVAKE